MRNDCNQRIYRLWAPFYDLLFRPVFARTRRRAVELLTLKPGERLLIPGIGTGLDLPLLPHGVSVVGIDLSKAMLKHARSKVERQDIILLNMDAQQLGLPDASFDAVLLNLIVSVAPDGAAAFREAWRVLRLGGRIVIFDKFLPEDKALTPGRRLAGIVLRALGTDPNRRLGGILSNVPDVVIECDDPSLIGGAYRILRLSRLAKSPA
jgi:ubiquinone/menaquinone biosynthesis C-methylase UbiE